MGDKPSAENDTRENGDGGSGSERPDNQSLDEGTAEETEVESDGAVQRSSHGAVQSDTVGASGPTDSRGSADGTGGYVAYDAGPDSQNLADRYGIEVGRRDVHKLQRLENEFGQGRVQRWAEEGMPVETMGKPRDMKAFRRQEEASSDNSVQPTPEEDSPEVSTGREANQESEQVAATEPETERETAGTEVNRSTEEAELGTGREETTRTDAETSAGEADSAGPEDSADKSVAVDGSDDSPPDEEGEEGTISVGRRVLQSDDSNEPRAEVGDKSDADGPQSRDSSRTDSELSRREAFRSVEALYSNGPLQAKLEVSSPDDSAEREAERIAAEVVDSDEPTGTADPRSPRRQAESDAAATEDEKVPERSDRIGSSHRSHVRPNARTDDEAVDPLIQRAASTGDVGPVGRGAEQIIDGAQTGGKPLSDEMRTYFEPRFGTDFSDVRIHTGRKADEAAQSINAKAFTAGSDIVFRKGTYDPHSTEGKRLIAHELVHVVQQRSGLTVDTPRAHPHRSSGMVYRHPAAGVALLKAVLAKCVTGAVAGVGLDALWQLNVGLWEGQLSANVCNFIISAIIGCVFSAPGATAAIWVRNMGGVVKITGSKTVQISKNSFREWLLRTGIDQIAGKGAVGILLKLATCEGTLEYDIAELETSGEDIYNNAINMLQSLAATVEAVPQDMLNLLVLGMVTADQIGEGFQAAAGSVVDQTVSEPYQPELFPKNWVFGSRYDSNGYEPVTNDDKEQMVRMIEVMYCNAAAHLRNELLRVIAVKGGGNVIFRLADPEWAKHVKTHTLAELLTGPEIDATSLFMTYHEIIESRISETAPREHEEGTHTFAGGSFWTEMEFIEFVGVGHAYDLFTVTDNGATFADACHPEGELACGVTPY
jgi:hypothetical protein